MKIMKESPNSFRDDTTIFREKFPCQKLSLANFNYLTIENWFRNGERERQGREIGGKFLLENEDELISSSCKYYVVFMNLLEKERERGHLGRIANLLSKAVGSSKV